MTAATGRVLAQACPGSAGALDYYLVLDGAEPGGMVVEEFTFGGDFTAVGLDCAGWFAGDRQWWSSAEFSRSMRGDPVLRDRVMPVERGRAEAAYVRMGGGELPGEAALRGYFRDHQPMPVSAPLRFGGEEDRRIYRLLCAKELDERGVAGLCSRWLMSPVRDPHAGVVGSARHEGGIGLQLRRIARGMAWCIDVTVPEPPGDALGDLLSGLRRDVRRHGLIPVTIERLA